MKDHLTTGIFTIIGALVGGMLAYFSATKVIDVQQQSLAESKFLNVIAYEFTQFEFSIFTTDQYEHVFGNIEKIRAASIEYSFYLKSDPAIILLKDSMALLHAYKDLVKKKCLAQEKCVLDGVDDIRSRTMTMGRIDYKKSSVKRIVYRS